MTASLVESDVGICKAADDQNRQREYRQRNQDGPIPPKPDKELRTLAEPPQTPGRAEDAIVARPQ